MNENQLRSRPLLSGLDVIHFTFKIEIDESGVLVPFYRG